MIINTYRIDLKQARKILLDVKSKQKPAKTFRLGFRSRYGTILKKRNYNLTEKLLQNIETVKQEYANKRKQ